DRHWVNFVITNQPASSLRLATITLLSVFIGVRSHKVVTVDVKLQRQVGNSSYVAVSVWESVRHSDLFCYEPYCVGNPIGKPFIISRLDSRATPEQRRRAFDLNVNWLTRFRGDPRICDLAPSAWNDWKKAVSPDDVAVLQQTYHCP